MDGVLFCNYKNCRTLLSSEAWITSCSHIFCSEHLPSSPDSARKCPFCGRDLQERNDVFKRALNPPNSFKLVAFAGFNPSKILEAGLKALEFLNYQWFHEKTLLQSSIKCQDQRLAKIEDQRMKEKASYQMTIDKLKILIQQQSQNCERLQRDMNIILKKNQYLEENVKNKKKLIHKLLSNQEFQDHSSQGGDWVDRPKNVPRRGASSYEHHRTNSGSGHMFCSQQLPVSSYNTGVPFGSFTSQRSTSISHIDQLF